MKLELYNKRLLAIIGTTVLVIALVALVSLCVVLFGEVSRLFDDDDQNNQLVVDRDLADEKSGNVTLVHTGYPQLVDSAKGLFIVPLSQMSVPQEDANGEVLNSFESGGYRKHSYYKTFNNLVIYNEVSGETSTMFKEKLLITDFDVIEVDSTKFLLAEIVLRDSDEDGVLNSKDTKAVSLYNFKTNKLEILDSEGLMYRDFELRKYSRVLYLHFYNDINGNRKVDKTMDPVVLRRYSMGKGIQQVVPDEIIEQVKKTIN